MKKYLLTVFGDFKEGKLNSRLIKGMELIVDSEHIKYIEHNESVVLFHFGSEVSFEEINDYISGIFYGLSDAFILTELNDKTSVYLPDSIKAHLLDLENSSEDTHFLNVLSKIDKSNDDVSELADDFVGFLLEEMEEEIKIPSLNQLLDKINQKGLSSLSPFEKEVLEEYSKN